MGLKLLIGSRPSPLALAQAGLVKASLEAAAPGLDAVIVPIRTGGDRITSPSLARLGGKGLFVRELERSLLERKIDLAVHSMKDLPATLAPGFRIAVVPRRESARDALVAAGGGGLDTLKPGARLGTSSARRRFEVLRLRPDLEVSPLRGNVDTRLTRLSRGDLDALVVACAGLKRLGRFEAARAVELPERDFVPAAGQGALAVEVLGQGPPHALSEIETALQALNDPPSQYETAAERAFLARLGASCATPVGVKASVEDERLSMRALLFSPDGTRWLEDEIEGALDEGLERGAPVQAAELGARLGSRMLERGAARMISGE